jgi:hypothetical protein
VANIMWIPSCGLGSARAKKQTRVGGPGVIDHLVNPADAAAIVVRPPGRAVSQLAGEIDMPRRKRADRRAAIRSASGSAWRPPPRRSIYPLDQAMWAGR